MLCFLPLQIDEVTTCIASRSLHVIMNLIGQLSNLWHFIGYWLLAMVTQGRNPVLQAFTNEAMYDERTNAMMWIKTIDWKQALFVIRRGVE